MSGPRRPVIIPIGPSIAYVQLTNGQFSLIDACDAERVGRFNWKACWDRKTCIFYASRCTSLDGINKTHFLHNEVLKPRPGLLADHASRNTLDNRRANLREATRSQNNMNQRIFVTNTSGYKGVTRHKCGKFQASVVLNGKYHYRGLHQTAELAHIAASVARAELHGEFARER